MIWDILAEERVNWGRGRGGGGGLAQEKKSPDFRSSEVGICNIVGHYRTN